MSNDPSISKTAYWASWGMSAAVAFIFLMSATMKLTAHPQALAMFGHLGWQPGALTTLALLESACLLLYLIPKTSVLGAIVLTGYLGGAIATHMRIGEPVYLHIAIGVFIWGGLYLREPRLRALIPLRG